MPDNQGDGAADVRTPTGDTGVLRTTDALEGALELDSVSIVHHEAASSSLEAPAGTIIVDYLRATLPDNRETWQALDGWFGPSQMRPVGWRSYYSSSAIVLDGGLLAWCDDPSVAEVRGVLVDLPGRACAAMGDALLPFLEWCVERGHVARIDFAMDDRSGLFSPQTIVDAWDSGAVVSRWRAYKELRTAAKGGELLGHTVYMGSRSSDAVVRVYDKALEQKRPGMRWVRLELEAKGKLSHALAAKVLEHGGAAVVGQLNRRVRFVEPGTDSNKRRWQPAAWWESFLGDLTAGPGLIIGQEPTCTIEQVGEYLEQQAGPSLWAYLEAHGGDVSCLTDIARRSGRRAKPRHIAAVQRYQEQTLDDLRRQWAERSEQEAIQ